MLTTCQAVAYKDVSMSLSASETERAASKASQLGLHPDRFSTGPDPMAEMAGMHGQVSAGSNN